MAGSAAPLPSGWMEGAAGRPSSRFRKCVSRAWRALISDPANRRRFAQTLEGLFFSRPYGSRPTWDFIGLSVSSVLPPPPGVDTALSFLPPTCGEMELLDSCNGLLLLRCEDSREPPSPPPFFVVCNPATGEWVALPQPNRVPGLVGYSTTVGPTMDTASAALGFDPSNSPHFHVFQLVQVLDPFDFYVRAVEIYSSQTGRWILSAIELQGEMADESDDIRYGGLVYVDSNVWMSDVLSIYVLEDHDSEEWMWIFKQSINKPDLFRPRMFGRGWDYYTAAFHPDSDLIFLL